MLVSMPPAIGAAAAHNPRSRPHTAPWMQHTEEAVCYAVNELCECHEYLHRASCLLSHCGRQLTKWCAYNSGRLRQEEGTQLAVSWPRADPGERLMELFTRHSWGSCVQSRLSSASSPVVPVALCEAWGRSNNLPGAGVPLRLTASCGGMLQVVRGWTLHDNMAGMEGAVPDVGWYYGRVAACPALPLLHAGGTNCELGEVPRQPAGEARCVVPAVHTI